MKRAGVFIGLLIVFTGAGYAAEDSGIILDRIVVTSSRSDEYVEEVPNNITVIGKGQIERSKAKTIPELLNSDGTVMMRDYTGNGKTTNADVRGFGDAGASNIVVMVDGRRVNNIDSSNTDWTQIPLSMVEKIEILHGAGSVLYGDNAMGGVINIVTKEPPKKPYELKLGLLTGSYSTYGEKGELSVSRGGFSGLGFFEQYRTDGYRINSDLLRNDTNVKLLYAFNADWKAKFNFGDHHDKYGMPGGLKDDELNSRDRRA